MRFLIGQWISINATSWCCSCWKFVLGEWEISNCLLQALSRIVEIYYSITASCCNNWVILSLGYTFYWFLMMLSSLDNLLSLDIHKLTLAITTHTDDLSIIFKPDYIKYSCCMNLFSFHYKSYHENITWWHQYSWRLFLLIKIYSGWVIPLLEIVNLCMLLSWLCIDISYK